MYVPREWMLVTAYKAADEGNYAPLRTLHELFKTPYAPRHTPCFPALIDTQIRRAPGTRRNVLHARA
jgi:hypothetical protein